MVKVPMKAERSMTYNTRRLKAGDIFEAKNEAEAKILAHRRFASPHIKAAAKKSPEPTPPPITTTPLPPVVISNVTEDQSKSEKKSSKKSKE